MRFKKEKRKQNRPSKVNCEATAPPTAYEVSFSLPAFRSQSQFKYVGSPRTSTRSLSFYEKLLSGLDFKLTLMESVISSEYFLQDIKKTFHVRMGSIKDKNGKDLV